MKQLIEAFHAQFSSLHSRTVTVAQEIPADKLFWKPETTGKTFRGFSCGELILRSAGAVEQTFGGITTRLWDDPFEWTLPEELSTNQKVIEYLLEVQATRERGFSLFKSDEDLQKSIPAPEAFKSIGGILVETIGRAEQFYGQSLAICRYIVAENIASDSKT